MSVFRPSSGLTRTYINDGKNKFPNGISVKCPKCQSNIVITESSGNAPIRCEKCNYPMIRRSDLLLLIDACKNMEATPDGGAVSVLLRLSEYIPEAGTALGLLANRLTLPLSTEQRWNKLLSAYAGGDEKAQEGLSLMCASHPERYEHRYCKNCGASKYIEKLHSGKTVCIYCQSSD